MNLSPSRNNHLFTWTLHLAGVGVIALTLGGFCILVYQPLQAKRIHQAERSEQLDVLLVKTRTTGSEYRRLRSRLAEMQSSVAEMQSQLKQAPTEKERIQNISDIATNVGLKIQDYQIGLNQSLATHSQTEVEFQCVGSYASICKFLHQTEQLTRITKLSKFELNSTGNSDVYPIQITFVLYSGAQSNDTKERRGVL